MLLGDDVLTSTEFVGLAIIIAMITPIIIYSIVRIRKKQGAALMIEYGWLLTIAGAIGTVVAHSKYNEAKEDYENRIYAYLSEAKSNMEIAQNATYICIAATVLGVVLLIVGYIIKSSKDANIRQEALIKHIIAQQGTDLFQTNRTLQENNMQTESTHDCPHCGATIPDDAKFCSLCGKKIDRDITCPNCGLKNQSDAKFCYSCGNKIE